MQTLKQSSGSTGIVRLTIVSVLTILFLGILFIHARYYLPFLSDDSLISLRYSQRLLEGKGLTWTEGIPVEGYSNLLWVLLTALPALFNIDLVLGVRIFGFIGMGIVIFTYGWYYYRSNRLNGNELFPLMIGLLFFVLAAPIAVWAIGGLEQPLVAAWLAPVITLNMMLLTNDIYSKKHVLLLSFFLGLICLTRVDGLIYTFIILLTLVILKGINRKTIECAIMIIIFPAVFTSGQLLFRIIYYHTLIPNTALVKVSPSARHFQEGYWYLKNGVLSLNPVAVLAVIGLPGMIFMNKQKRIKAIFLIIAGGVYSAYLFFIGGDIFPAYRHFIPIITLMTIIIIEASAYAWKKLPKIGFKIGLICILFIFFAFFVKKQLNHPQSLRAKYEKLAWDGKVVGLFLRQAFHEQQPLFAVTAPGCLPYWSELPCLDMLGLNDYYLPRHLPEDFGDRDLGHELGDGRYVFEQRPDIISFCGPRGSVKPCFRSAEDLLEMPEFHHEYILVSFRCEEPYPLTSKLWVNKNSIKIGMRYTNDSTIVPGYLWNGNNTTVCYLDDYDMPVVPLKHNQPLKIFDLTLPAAVKEITTVPFVKGLLATVKRNEEGRYNITLTSPGQALFDIKDVVIRH